jgi:hypothetical protein
VEDGCDPTILTLVQSGHIERQPIPLYQSPQVFDARQALNEIAFDVNLLLRC